MDLLAIIRSGIDSLPEGEYVLGLKAVVNHIEVAIRHLETGQKSGENQLYTDAIYRCNQAFEGSLKELYRVLSKNDPTKTTPQKIEKFLDDGSVLRPKVISQLSRYRQEWRNPSTHDYTMDFDENEAFLAIVNIAALAKMAVGQIASKIAFDLARSSDIVAPTIKPKAKRLSGSEDLAETVAIYAAVYLQDSSEMKPDNAHQILEGQIASMLAGFLSKVEGMAVSIEHRLSDSEEYFADIFASNGDGSCVVELKTEKSFESSATRGLEQLARYMELARDSSGVLIVHGEPGSQYKIYKSNLVNRLIFIVTPVESHPYVSKLNVEYEIEEFMKSV